MAKKSSNALDGEIFDNCDDEFLECAMNSLLRLFVSIKGYSQKQLIERILLEESKSTPKINTTPITNLNIPVEDYANKHDKDNTVKSEDASSIFTSATTTNLNEEGVEYEDDINTEYSTAIPTSEWSCSETASYSSISSVTNDITTSATTGDEEAVKIREIDQLIGETLIKLLNMASNQKIRIDNNEKRIKSLNKTIDQFKREIERLSNRVGKLEKSFEYKEFELGVCMEYKERDKIIEKKIECLEVKIESNDNKEFLKKFQELKEKVEKLEEKIIFIA